MKILHLVSSLNRGGRERQLAIILNNTDQKKYPTRILYFNNGGESYINEYNLNDYTIQIKAKTKLSRILELNKVLKKEKPDVVYTWGNGESVSIILLKPFHQFKFINGSVRHGIRSKKFSHYFRTLILHLSPYIVSNSYAGLRANNLKKGMVLYNGIDPKFIGKLSEKKKSAQRVSFLPKASGKLLFISVANLVPYKDYFSVLKALQSINKRDYDFHYSILGEGPLRSEIENAIKQYGLEDEVTLAGNVENVNEYLQMADIFIHSSKGEGCSNAILEAMAAGLPVVASNTGGTSEIVNEKNGVLFDYKNVRQLKDNLQYFLENSLERESAGTESLKMINENFTIPQMMNNYYFLIRNLS